MSNQYTVIPAGAGYQHQRFITTRLMQDLDILDIEGVAKQPAGSVQQLPHRGAGERGVA